MNKVVLSAIMASIAFPALAADEVYVDPVVEPFVAGYDWTGAYGGIFAGYGSGDPDWAYNAGLPVDIDIEGGLIGLTGGYNFQSGSWVFGLEADIAAADIDGNAPCPNPTFTCRADIDWLGTVRARAGVASNNWLFFGTGGVAFGGTTAETIQAGTVTGTSHTRAGYVVGAGIEWGITERVSTKLEYNYYDLGSDQYTVDNGLLVNADFDLHAVKIGINYRF